MKYLVQTTEVYRVDSEAEAVELIESAKKDRMFTLTKYTTEYKEVKSKGEVVDDYYKVTLTKMINDIKEPASYVNVYYSELTTATAVINNSEVEF